MKMKQLTWGLGLILGSAACLAQAIATASPAHGARSTTTYGDSLALGKGRLKSYISRKADGTTQAIGVEFHKNTLVGLPDEHNDGRNCWDSNADNSIDLDSECSGGHGYALKFPANTTPFDHISVDWEPHGHVPADVYDIPHFDFHFYMVNQITRNLIAVGPCFGTINCEIYQKAIVPIPASNLHPDFDNTQLAFSRMGNHWIDRTSPEFHGQPFTHTFILGSFDGQLTFMEPMVSLPYLLTKPRQCTAIKQPEQYQVSGQYPMKYCIRFQPADDKYTISLEDFRYRQAN